MAKELSPKDREIKGAMSAERRRILEPKRLALMQWIIDDTGSSIDTMTHCLLKIWPKASRLWVMCLSRAGCRGSLSRLSYL